MEHLTNYRRGTSVIALAVLLCLAAGLLVFAVVPLAHAVESYGLDETAKKAGLAKGKTSLAVYLGQVVGAVLFLIGGIFLVLMIYGGVLWMTAAGNDQQVAKAKLVLTAAVIGTVIVFASYALTSYIFDALASRAIS